MREAPNLKAAPTIATKNEHSSSTDHPSEITSRPVVDQLVGIVGAGGKGRICARLGTAKASRTIFLVLDTSWGVAH